MSTQAIVPYNTEAPTTTSAGPSQIPAPSTPQDVASQTLAGAQPVPTQTSAGPSPEPPKRSLMSDILHAVGEVLGGPSTRQQVNPQTGAIENVPLSRTQRIANTAGIYMRGAAAGAAQHGPGAAGKAALAGVNEQQETQQRQVQNTEEESRNVQAQISGQASRALQAQQIAESGWRMQREGTEIDEGTAEKFNAMQGLIAENPGNKDLGHYATFADLTKAHPELQQAGVNIPQLMAQGRIRAIVTTEGGKATGIQAYEVNPDWEKQKITDPITIKIPNGLDGKGNVQYKTQTIPAGSVSNGEALQYFGSAGKSGLDASEKSQQLKIQQETASSEAELRKSEESKNFAEAHKAIAETGIKGSDEMIDKGRNPFTGEQLTINNAPNTQMVDSQGNPIPFKNLAAMKPSAQENNRAAFAKSVLHIFDNLDDMKAKGKLPNGPIEGLTKQGLAKAGLGDHDAQEALNFIGLAQSAATGAHVGGRFNVEILNKMGQMIKLNMNDSQFQGAEDALRDVMKGYVANGGRITAGEWKQDHSLFAQAPGKPSLVSYDNGKTWNQAPKQ